MEERAGGERCDSHEHRRECGPCPRAPLCSGEKGQDTVLCRTANRTGCQGTLVSALWLIRPGIFGKSLALSEPQFPPSMISS